MKLGLIIFLWVIHVAALIGIALGYESFFLPKSPFTMLYLLLMVVLYFPIDTGKKVALFGAFAVVGLLVEWIGVHTGALFGNYYYLENFGIKIDGIPLLIGVNWAILAFTTHVIATKLTLNIWTRILAGSSLMVIIDFFLEQICEYAGFWVFAGGAGIFNYVCWFVVAALLHWILAKSRVKGDLVISTHIYIVQLIFAATLWIIISTI
ncbi:carotenoid biosynthesis protein [Nonlabens ponticola]|uniref:Carotenoid biosynthesis protein n=1 Tax=Nonlabens ponticola TaxID=2496866 RepID=A0A3S9N029_9FLAO|nr:carotenoid biosynthesis protein [Nonlabens ponticola]AZQ44895.1 carotenoid biosynthesis protein [Nonlabens ponticola]